jgi:16S rRNA (uracil1498-N3)-methyltransferase
MRRLVVDGEQFQADDTVLLDAQTHHYVTNVLRLAAGDSVEVADGTGTLWHGQLAWAGGMARVHDLRVIRRAEDQTRLVLVAALLKGNRWEWLLEKATELGVHTIQPVAASRSIVKVDLRDVTDRTARWQKIADAAMQQSQGLIRTTVRPVVTLDTALQSVDGLRLVADEKQTSSAWPSFDATTSVQMYVGPEGGWTDQERAAMTRLGVQGVGLGSRILRAETAGIAMLSGARLRLDGVL